MRKNVQGFTLVELLIVIVVIGILLLVAINSFGRARESITYDNEVAKVLELVREGRQLSLSSREETALNKCDDGSKPYPVMYAVKFYRGQVILGKPARAYLYTDICPPFNEFDEADPTPLDDGIVVYDSLELNDDFNFRFIGQVGAQSVNIMFEPPYADLSMDIDGDLRLEFGAAEGYDMPLKTIYLNPISGIPEVVKSEEIT